MPKITPACRQLVATGRDDGHVLRALETIESLSVDRVVQNDSRFVADRVACYLRVHGAERLYERGVGDPECLAARAELDDPDASAVVRMVYGPDALSAAGTANVAPLAQAIPRLPQERVEGLGPVLRILSDQPDSDGAAKLYAAMCIDRPPTKPELRAECKNYSSRRQEAMRRDSASKAPAANTRTERNRNGLLFSILLCVLSPVYVWRLRRALAQGSSEVAILGLLSSLTIVPIFLAFGITVFNPKSTSISEVIAMAALFVSPVLAIGALFPRLRAAVAWLSFAICLAGAVALLDLGTRG